MPTITSATTSINILNENDTKSDNNILSNSSRKKRRTKFSDTTVQEAIDSLSSYNTNNGIITDDNQMPMDDDHVGFFFLSFPWNGLIDYFL